MEKNDQHTVVGIDIGGSHITAALVDLHRRAVLPRSAVRLKVDPHASAAEIIGVWTSAIGQAQAGGNKLKVGIAMPGPFDYEKGISLIRQQNKYDALYGLPVKDMLADSLSCTPEDVRMNNDAACFLQGEAFGGAVSSFEHCVGLTLGTGLGSAVCRRGEAENLDLWCVPYREGMAEDYLSTRWFTGRYEALTGKKVHGVKELAGSTSHDAYARQVFEEFSGHLSGFLQYVMEREGPQAIVLGGNISHAYALFAKAVENTQLQFPAVRIFRASLGEDAAVLGAASLWRE